MKEVLIIEITIEEPTSETSKNAEKVVSSLISALQEGGCKDAEYSIIERYKEEKYKVIIVPDNET